MKWVCLSYKSSLKGILQLNFWYLFFQWVPAALPAKSQFDTDGINLSNFDKYVFPNVFTIQFRILFSLYSIVFWGPPSFLWGASGSIF